MKSGQHFDDLYGSVSRREQTFIREAKARSFPIAIPWGLNGYWNLVPLDRWPSQFIGVTSERDRHRHRRPKRIGNRLRKASRGWR